MNARSIDAVRKTRRHLGARGVPTVSVLAAAVLVGSALTAPASLASPPARPAITADPVGQLGALLGQLVAAGVPGAIVRVEQGRQLTQVAAGVTELATRAPLRPDAEFRVGSITKTFVATVVLQLVERRHVVLDEPVSRWLPGLLPDGNTITVRELLNHTSGLFDYTADPTVLAGIANNRAFAPTDLVSIANAHPRSFPPGTAWQYSSTNYIVLGLLVQAVTGNSLRDELARRIIKPLGLTHTSFPETTGHIAGYHAHGCVPIELIPTPDGKPLDVTGLNPSNAWAAGAIVSNTADLTRFYRALLGGRLLGPSMLAQMKTTRARRSR